MVKRLERVDHRPVVISFLYRAYFEQPMEEIKKLDRDKLALAVTTGLDRDKFLGKLHRVLDDKENEAFELAQSGGMGEIAEFLDQSLLEAATPCYVKQRRRPAW
eukprot:4925510-Lingulodinium_polyedra.AAC.1